MMMRFYENVLRGCAVFLVALAVLFASSYVYAAQTEWIHGDVMVRDLCPNRTATEVTNMVTQFGNRAVRLIFDGGAWEFHSDVTFPTNCTVVSAPDSPFWITNGAFLTFQTNVFENGAYESFTGDGVATGKALFVFRHVEWGPAKHDIGLGKIGFTNTDDVVRTSAGYTMAAGTTAGLSAMTAGTGTITKATITSGMVATAVITDTYLGASRITPVSGTETIAFTSNMTDTAITTLITNAKKYVPSGSVLRFLFGAGNYTNLYAKLNFNKGFFGGGHVQIYGTGWQITPIMSTNQSVFLDFSLNSTDSGIQCGGPGITWEVRQLRIKAIPTESLDGPIDVSNGRVEIQSCFLEGANTNSGSCVAARNMFPLEMSGNYFKNHTYGLRAEDSYVYSASNITLSAINTGVWLRKGAYFTGKNSIQPTGTVANALLQDNSHTNVGW